MGSFGYLVNMKLKAEKYWNFIQQNDISEEIKIINKEKDNVKNRQYE